MLSARLGFASTPKLGDSGAKASIQFSSTETHDRRLGSSAPAVNEDRQIAEPEDAIGAHQQSGLARVPR